MLIISSLQVKRQTNCLRKHERFPCPAHSAEPARLLSPYGMNPLHLSCFSRFDIGNSSDEMFWSQANTENTLPQATAMVKAGPYASHANKHSLSIAASIRALAPETQDCRGPPQHCLLPAGLVLKAAEVGEALQLLT
jgi:hypothetical protein